MIGADMDNELFAPAPAAAAPDPSPAREYAGDEGSGAGDSTAGAAGDSLLFAPLAARMRPRTLEEYAGQSHILGPGRPLRRVLESGACQSMVLWGPPGTGKTTLAEMMASRARAAVRKISAVTSGIKDIREAVEAARKNRLAGQRTVLFVDEVHRFNKSQQDAFLPFIEDGTIFFIGATTENPSFELNSALLSRLRVYVLKSLTREEILSVITRALEQDPWIRERRLVFQEGALECLVDFSCGDARRALNFLEALGDLAETGEDGTAAVTLDLVRQVLGRRPAAYDRKGEQYYNLISALHKSVRGSCPDAALYWYARILEGGGDPLYVARRLLAIASEDVGNADPNAMRVALNAWDCFERVGAAEGERAIAQALVYLAAAPKSNAVYLAWHAAREAAAASGELEVPMHLRNAPTALMEELGYHKGYRYPHDEPGAYAAGETYLPPELGQVSFYQPTDRGTEARIRQKLAELRALDEAAGAGSPPDSSSSPSSPSGA